jgi:hypothetical protein
MFGLLGRAFRTKVGIALIGALLVGGGGTAMAMATSTGHTPFGSALSSSTHSDDAGKTPGATKSAEQGDEDDQGCTSSTSGTPSAHSDSDDASEHASGTPSATGTPGAHSDDASEHEVGTPSATKTASQGDDANEHEGSSDDQDECSKGTTTRTPAPEPTERPEGTHTPWPTRAPEPTGTPGTGGD